MFINAKDNNEVLICTGNEWLHTHIKLSVRVAQSVVQEG